MTTQRTYSGITWIDMLSPTAEEVRALIETHNINPDVSKNMILPSPVPQVYDYRDLIYLVMHFPIRHKSHGKVTTQEIDFLLTKKVLVTIHYEPIEALQQFEKFFEVSSILKNQKIPHAGMLFFEIVKHLYDGVKDEIDSIDDELKTIEPNVFHGRERKVIIALSSINHSLLQFKQRIGIQRESLEIAGSYAESIFGQEFTSINRTLLAEHSKIIKEIEYRRETWQGLWNINDTLLSTRQSEIMKNLAMVSFITFPLSLIVAIFALYSSIKNSDNGANEFVALISILVIALACMLFFFKQKKWI